MPRRELIMTAVDDGTSVQLRIEEYVGIGSSRVGPVLIFEGDMLSLPFGHVSEWRRDMAVLMVERL